MKTESKQQKCGLTEDCFVLNGLTKERMKVSRKNLVYNVLCSLRSAKRGSSTLVTQIETQKTDLMTTVLQDKVEAKRHQGRPPTSYIDNVKADSSLQLYDVIHQSRDRDR